MMIGWRRKAKAERARLEAQAIQTPISAERLYELVNQTLHANFGPLGSYAITRRATSDTDDIFHTMLASSVAHDIVGTLIRHDAVPLLAAPPIAGSFVAATSAFASTHALPAEPLSIAEPAPVAVRVGSHAVVHAEVAPTVPARVPAAQVAVVPAFAAAGAGIPVSASTAVPVSASAVAPASPIAVENLHDLAAGTPVSLAPIVAVPVSADLAAALTVLDETGEIALPAPVAAVRTHLVDAGR